VIVNIGGRFEVHFVAPRIYRWGGVVDVRVFPYLAFRWYS
jgi:hypothetical protein